MAKRKIIITEADRKRLEELLDSAISQVSESDHLDDLKKELEQARTVAPEKVPDDVVTMNSTVTLRDLDTQETETYTLVYPNRADIANERLSILAPIGTAILGHRVGDELRWPVPEGVRRLKVEQVIYQPEREGAFHL